MYTGWTWPKMGSMLFAAVFIALHFVTGGLANPDAKRLYDDLLSNYNRLIRPVGNNSDRLTVKMGLRLSQLIDVVGFLPFLHFQPPNEHLVATDAPNSGLNIESKFLESRLCPVLALPTN
uniref:Neurotransmitter-gated ion-channel ligand-binding domain-containing protein n=1 Tax=Glossina brevipalpis TaxID=37001 RepID=A0A1A9X480_9MUSC